MDLRFDQLGLRKNKINLKKLSRVNHTLTRPGPQRLVSPQHVFRIIMVIQTIYKQVWTQPVILLYKQICNLNSQNKKIFCYIRILEFFLDGDNLP